MSANNDGYEIGYGRPPRQNQFKRGQSGNPQGRPKGTLNLATVLERTLREEVVINENGQRKTITKLEAAIKQLVNAAASGEPRATQMLFSLVRSAESTAELGGASEAGLGEADQKVVEGILKRFETKTEGAAEK